MDKNEYHRIAVDNELRSTRQQPTFRNEKWSVNSAINIRDPYGTGIGFELDAQELIIYKNMLGKFLSNGGELKNASVIWDSDTKTYSIILEGINGNKFLFSTSNLQIRDIETLPLNGRFLFTKKYNQPLLREAAKVDGEEWSQEDWPPKQTKMHTISMNRLRESEFGISEFSPSSGFTGKQAFNHLPGDPMVKWSWKTYRKICTLESASRGDRGFYLGLNFFTIPLIADSSSTNQTMKAYELSGSDVIIGTTYRRDPFVDGLYLNADMPSEQTRNDGKPTIQLDWVAADIRPTLTNESLWELAGLTNVVEQEKGTLEKWFASRKCKKYYPHGVIRVDFEKHLTTSYLSETYDSEVGEVKASIIRKNPEYLFDSGYSSVGLNYHTFKKMVTTNRDFNINISDLMILKEDAKELIGTDGERFLYGFRCNDLECMITLDSMTNHYGYSMEVEPSLYFESEIFKKWYDFAADYCKRRNMDAPQLDVDTIFKLYINSGEMTSEDVDEYNRLK